jgi:hypothetical protein
MSELPKLQSHDRIAAEMFAAAEKGHKDTRRYLGMSEIGATCDRRIWFSFRGFPKQPLDGRLIMLFGLGDLIEGQVIAHLNAAGLKVDGQQDGYEAHNGYFKGHSDGTIHGVTRRPHILEVKSANDKRFAAFKEFGVRETYPTYYCQAQCYMGYGKLERALFVIVNKNNSEIYTERVYFSPDDFAALDARARYIITANAMPDKGPDCTWCDYERICPDVRAGVYTRTTCGSCNSLWWDADKIVPHCQHPAHAHIVEEWGSSCPDWAVFQDSDVPF